MNKPKTVYAVCILCAVVGIVAVLAAAQSKTSEGKQATQKHTKKHSAPKATKTVVDDDPTIVINNCIASLPSLEAKSSVTFSVDPKDTHSYYIFIEKPEAFHGLSNHHLLIDNKTSSGKIPAHSGNNQIKTLWWADPTTPCTRALSAKGRASSAGDPNDITVP